MEYWLRTLNVKFDLDLNNQKQFKNYFVFGVNNLKFIFYILVLSIISYISNYYYIQLLM